MVLRRVDIAPRVVEIRRVGGDEFRAGGQEEFFKNGEGLGAPTLHASELIAILLAKGGMDGIVKTDGAKGNTDGDESIHLVVLLGDLHTH